MGQFMTLLLKKADDEQFMALITDALEDPEARLSAMMIMYGGGLYGKPSKHQSSSIKDEALWMLADCGSLEVNHLNDREVEIIFNRIK